MTDHVPGGPSGSPSGLPAPTINDTPQPGAAAFRRRRIAVAAALGAAVVLVIGTVVVASRGDAPQRLGTVASTTTTTTTTTVPATTSTSTTSTTSSTTTTSTTTTTTTTTEPPPTTILDAGVPIWPQYELRRARDGVAALTGMEADESITSRPILAVKIDNFSRARPQWGLDRADVVIEENVEGVTRFVALFHSDLPDRVGPVRSARTGDLDLFAMMNRPVLGWSGGNAGVTRWVESAADSRLLVNFSAQNNPCYERTSSRRIPHNLLLDSECAVNTAFEPGPAVPLWAIRDGFEELEGATITPDTTFEVPMDGVRVTWQWDAERGAYLRFQNGNPHLAISGEQIAVNNVVEVYTDHPPSPVDARSPNPVTVGGGRAVVHRDGRRIEALWGRDTPYEAFGFAVAETGEPIFLDAGRTFLHLARA